MTGKMAAHRSSRENNTRRNRREMCTEMTSNKEISTGQSSTTHREETKFEYIPVPVRDQRTALSSIENSIETIKQSEKYRFMDRNKRQRSDEDTQNNNSFCTSSSKSPNRTYKDKENGELKHKFGQLERTKNNLQERFNHLTVQLDIEEYNKLLKRKLMPKVDVDDDDSSSSSEEEDESVSSVEDVENEEWDEKEYVDMEALARVKSLRSKVLEASSRICSKRDALKRRAVSLTKDEEIEKLCNANNDDANDDDDDDEDEIIDGEDCVKMKEMAATLEEMTKNVKYVDKNLPEKIEALQETIDTIEASINKLKRQASTKEAGDNENENDLDFLPRTERAILSRMNEGGKDNATKEESSGDCNDDKENEEHKHNNMSPEKRFALYLLQG